MNADLSTTIYVALFGGDEEDTGKNEDEKQYWGNALETDSDFKLRSKHSINPQVTTCHIC